MKLYAISDLQLGHAANRQALAQLPADPEDYLRQILPALPA